MSKMPSSLLAFRMARLEVLEYVVRRMVHEHLIDSGQAEAGAQAYSQQARQHFEVHLPLNIPRPEMIAAVDLFFNALVADIKADPRNH